jgi:sigma-B regulation protein RsbU (phosphoserine phosphatase)
MIGGQMATGGTRSSARKRAPSAAARPGAPSGGDEPFRATFEDAPIGMARADASGRLRHVNRALCETIGRGAQELIGSTLDELGPRADAGIDAAQRGQLVAGRIARYEIERRLSGPCGISIPVLVSASLARAAQGTAAELILHVQDLRDRREGESDRGRSILMQWKRVQGQLASERLALMQSIAVAALGAEDLEELLRELLDRLLEALGAERAAIVLVDEQDRVVARAAGGMATVVQRDAGAQLDEVVARVAAERGPISILDVPAAGIDASSLGPAVSSLLAVPLVVGGRVIGSLHVGTLARREFGEQTVDLLRLAADRASLAIARTRLHDREHRIAEDLQRSLLPSALPSVAGVTLAARYLPGDAGVSVGGDWYDAIALSRGRVAVAIGDVVGHGTEAAATMGQMRSALHALLMEADDCGAMAERLNRFALGLGDCVMTTVVLAIFDPGSGILRYVNAGHPPPLLVGPSGGDAARFLEGAPSPPMGVMQAPAYRQRALQVERGSTLLLYTDGLIEKPTEVLDEGLERLRSAAAAAGACADLDVLCERVLDARGEASANNDDVTMMALHVPASRDERGGLEIPRAPLRGLA